MGYMGIWVYGVMRDPPRVAAHQVIVARMHTRHAHHTHTRSHTRESACGCAARVAHMQQSL